jgi:hypothetical protein
MRGKKTDPEFVSQFLAQCISRGLIAPEEMVKAAKSELQVIDDKIKEVEQLKLKRSKLLDVIRTFEKPESKEEEIRLLPFFNLQYPSTCRKICKSMIEIDSDGSSFVAFEDKDPELVFCIKQLVEAKIISNINHCLFRGEMFNEYMRFVLRETE